MGHRVFTGITRCLLEPFREGGGRIDFSFALIKLGKFSTGRFDQKEGLATFLGRSNPGIRGAAEVSGTDLSTVEAVEFSRVPIEFKTKIAKYQSLTLFPRYFPGFFDHLSKTI